MLAAWPSDRGSLLAFVYRIAAQKVAAVPSREHSQQFVVLPERLREILVLRVVVGLSAEQTAEAVGSTPSAVRLAQHRALVRLREAIDGANG
uniref:sigma factor-like helix-turn-helix DNA-binding protein n=1 Tax=Lentzea alba TaxID=2714351 RepID=UPI0039BEDF8B